MRAFEKLYADIYSAPKKDPNHEQLEKEAESWFSQIRAEYSEAIGERKWAEIDPTVDRSKIVEELRKTKNTAPGDDGIYYCHLKNLPASALDYLATIYENTTRCCYFPSMWKNGLTVLIQKPGKDPSYTSNYRPITLLVALGKVLERVINRKLSDYLEREQIIPESQAGFRVGRSTQDQLFKLSQDAATAVKNGTVTIASFFDVHKSYDKVWIEGLALKMHKARIPQPMIALLVDYLCNRIIRLKVGETMSSPIGLECGLPQGSIIAPALHNIWVHDIPTPPAPPPGLGLGLGLVNTKMSQFADDIATWSNAENARVARTRLQKFNDSISKWCKRWKIKLSTEKTQVIGFTRDKGLDTDQVYQVIDGTRINHQEKVTFLGISLDSNMSWRSQSSSLQTRLKQRIGVFASITGSVNFPRASNEVSIAILKAMIEPLVYYAPVVLCARSKFMFEQQDKLLAQAGRLALHIPKTISRKYVQDKTNISPSQERTLKLAVQYLSDPKRSSSVKAAFKQAVKQKSGTRPRTITPGSAISVYISK